jgi:hypothetical protein
MTSLFFLFKLNFSSDDEDESGRGVKWTHEEDNKLRAAVMLHQGKNWKSIAENFPGRTGIFLFL